MKKLLRKISNLRLAAIALALVAVVCAVVWASHSLRRSSVTVGSDKKIGITPEQITAIKAIGQWEFLSVSDEELVDTVRRGFFRDDHLVRIYYGTMRFGIDLGKAKPGWLAARGDTVVVTLPPISLLDHDFIDEARTKSFFESGRWTGVAVGLPPTVKPCTAALTTRCSATVSPGPTYAVPRTMPTRSSVVCSAPWGSRTLLSGLKKNSFHSLPRVSETMVSWPPRTLKRTSHWPKGMP